MKHEFKEIAGYDGKYIISNKGLVISLKRGNQYLKLLPIKKKHTTYLRVVLSKNGRTKQYSVHRLVAEYFLPKIEGKTDVNHIDNDGSNNRVNNLEWCTHSENMIHCHKQGRCSNITASDKASELAQAKSEMKYRELLDSDFVESYTLLTKINGKTRIRRRIKYYCKSCKLLQDNRESDAPIRVNKGTCNNCNKEKKI